MADHAPRLRIVDVGVKPEFKGRWHSARIVCFSSSCVPTGGGHHIALSASATMLYTSACQLLLLAAVVVAVPTTTLSTNSQQRKDQSAPAQSDIPVPDIGDRLVPLGLGALGILGVWSLGSRAKRQSRKADNSWRSDRRFPDFDPPPHQSVIGQSRYTDWDLADYPPYKPEEDEALQRDIALCVSFLVRLLVLRPGL